MATTRRTVKYDSKFEKDLHKVLKGCQYHVDMIPYVQHKKYEPDFVYINGTDTVYIEAKGRFRDSAEARKYVDIRKSLPAFTELVFVFQKPYTPMPNAKKRKDGTKFTHAQWAEKNGFTWYAPHEMPREWSKKC